MMLASVKAISRIAYYKTLFYFFLDLCHKLAEAFVYFATNLIINPLINHSMATKVLSNEFREKVDIVLEQTPELRKMTIHIGSLSLEDM